MATTTTEVDNELYIIAAEQRRELMAARVIESDLDLAFHLQLQEALTASLSLQPSSSTSPQPPLPPPPPLPTEEDSTTVTDIQNLELEKFETELHDLAITETETKKLRDDLYRRIHDQKLAREIQQMPEDQWLEFGDNFERPFGEGSSKSLNDDEVFRVYFKGLIGEESVGRGSVRTVTLAGVGVAICDSRDELIFELRKPVVVTEGESRRNVEWKALIEALNTAIALNLKRIVFYCDYYTLYQFVRGQWSPKQRKIATLMNQVNLLRQKFTDSRPSLIARNDVKFAFKLARESIDSQMSKVVVSSTTKLETCVICLEDTDAGEFFSVDDCKHRYCFSCMKQHVEVKLLHGMVPKCPHEDCNLELKIGSCEKFLTPKLIEMMRQRLKEASIPVTEKVYCPYPKCSALMSKTEVLENSRVAFVGAERSGARICIKCNGPFCISCKVPWHRSMTCADYKKRNPVPLVEDAKLKNLAARNLWRQCVKCNHMIELAAGCFHMTCRCGYEFCYTCGAEWKDKKATCECPLWDNEHILYDDDEDDEELLEDDEDDDYYDSDSDSDAELGFHY